jgi:selenocysteine lyase/cysteine desulfurase
MTVPSLYANMALVRIPDAVTAKLLELHGPGPVSSLHAKVLQVRAMCPRRSVARCVRRAACVEPLLSQDYLHYSHHVEVPIKFLEDQLFIRISAAPYNELADYDKVAEAVLAYASSA